MATLRKYSLMLLLLLTTFFIAFHSINAVTQEQTNSLAAVAREQNPNQSKNDQQCEAKICFVPMENAFVPSKGGFFGSRGKLKGNTLISGWSAEVITFNGVNPFSYAATTAVPDDRAALLYMEMKILKRPKHSDYQSYVALALGNYALRSDGNLKVGTRLNYDTYITEVEDVLVRYGAALGEGTFVGAGLVLPPYNAANGERKPPPPVGRVFFTVDRQIVVVREIQPTQPLSLPLKIQMYGSGIQVEVTFDPAKFKANVNALAKHFEEEY